VSDAQASWRVCPLGDELERDRILAAVARSLPGGAATRKNADYWRWKHVDNPFGRSTGTFGLSADNSVVGVRSFMRWAFRTVDGHKLCAVRAVDTSTSPDWRGQGVFTRLTLAAIDDLRSEGADLIFNTPNTASGPGYLKMGWQRVATVPLAIRPCRPLRLALGLLRRSGADDRVPNPAEFGMAELPRAEQLLAEPDFPNLLASHEKARPQAGLRTPRDPDYLNWRYARHPQVPYFACVLKEADGLTAVALVRPNWRFGLREIVVVELFARDADPVLARRCLSQLARSTHGDYLIGHFAAGSVERRALERAGYLPAPGQGIGLFARHVATPLPESLLDLSGWDLSLGDLELF
jgi:GNAT superfamily N-acetyltransferase